MAVATVCTVCYVRSAFVSQIYCNLSPAKHGRYDCLYGRKKAVLVYALSHAAFERLVVKSCGFLHKLSNKVAAMLSRCQNFIKTQIIYSWPCDPFGTNTKCAVVLCNKPTAILSFLSCCASTVDCTIKHGIESWVLVLVTKEKHELCCALCGELTRYKKCCHLIWTIDSLQTLLLPSFSSDRETTVQWYVWDGRLLACYLKMLTNMHPLPYSTDNIPLK